MVDDIGLADIKIAVIGLGYVGLPLALAFSSRYKVVGYDIDQTRIEELTVGNDRTLEVSKDELFRASNLSYSSDKSEIQGCKVYIVTVPTPIDQHKQPDFTALINASEIVGESIGEGAYVVYESTVYPGATESICIPVLEEKSGLNLNENFYVGYSPERANPGDSEHKVTSIIKVTSGSTPEAAKFIDKLYSSVIPAGTHQAASIQVAEAAKVIENIQRDVNIALINELAVLFNRLGIDTTEVLDAAKTKWNFLPFSPGLVGGHCIGVDPYYLAQKAQSIGFHPEIILAGRRVNDGMGTYVADELVRRMIEKKINVALSRVLIMGLTFKENCPDTRNTHVVDIVRRLEKFGIEIDIYDPWVDQSCAFVKRNALHVLHQLPAKKYDGIILAVGHEEFMNMNKDDYESLRNQYSVIYDVKSVLPRDFIDARL